MATVRNREGNLQMYRKKKWKSYAFKVSGSTYLHYFKGDMKKAKGQIFLTNVQSVVIPTSPPKGGKFVFQVNIVAEKSSQWILSASSNEERHKWMEMIHPGSTKAIMEEKRKEPIPPNSGNYHQQYYNELYHQQRSDPYRQQRSDPYHQQRSDPYHQLRNDFYYQQHPQYQQSHQQRGDSYHQQQDDHSYQQQQQSNPKPIDQHQQLIRRHTFANSSSTQQTFNDTRVSSSWSSSGKDPRWSLNLSPKTSIDEAPHKDEHNYCNIGKPDVHYYQNMGNETEHTDYSLAEEYIETVPPPSGPVLESQTAASGTSQPQKFSETSKRSRSLMDDLEDFTISSSTIKNLVPIGKGNFGEVFKADYKPSGSKKACEVAVKTLKNDSDKVAKKEMIREFAVMATMAHPNIVHLFGVVLEDDANPWIVIEYFPYGDLKSYLMKSPDKLVGTLVRYMKDIAMGMHYIAQKGLIHRDLAARNVLVGEGEICKVADFGLLRELPSDMSIYQSKTRVPLPIRWMPPEAITKKLFSEASDVWSYGVLQWELFNPYTIPYKDLSNEEVLLHLYQENRLPIPKACPPLVANIMKECWNKDPGQRPDFKYISAQLSTNIKFL